MVAHFLTLPNLLGPMWLLPSPSNLRAALLEGQGPLYGFWARCASQQYHSQADADFHYFCSRCSEHPVHRWTQSKVQVL